jgi:hypothetical protein
MKPMQRRHAIRTVIVAPLMLIVLSGVGWSQDNANTLAAKQDAADVRAARAAKEQQKLDAEYQATLAKKKTPAGPVDPWSGVRSAK